MKKKVNDLYSVIENEFEKGEWTFAEVERLMDGLKILASSIESETCEDCGHRPLTGACFTCKMD